VFEPVQKLRTTAARAVIGSNEGHGLTGCGKSLIGQESMPQGLKALNSPDVYGTAETVPFVQRRFPS
jgi:hypothetical protein